MVSILVRFSPGFLPGAGFLAEQELRRFFKERSFIMSNSLEQYFPQSMFYAEF
jgi:hypothetical protein